MLQSFIVKMRMVETYVEFRMMDGISLVLVVVGLRFVSEIIIVDCTVGYCPRRSSPCVMDQPAPPSLLC